MRITYGRKPCVPPGPADVLKLQASLNRIGDQALYIGLGDKDGKEICSPGTHRYQRIEVKLSDFWTNVTERQYATKTVRDYTVSMPDQGHPFFPRVLLAFVGPKSGSLMLQQASIRTPNEIETKAHQQVTITIMGSWIEKALKTRLKQAWDNSYSKLCLSTN